MNVQPQQQPPLEQAVPIQAPLQQWEIEANALNLQGEHRLLHELLRGFHNLTESNALG